MDRDRIVVVFNDLDSKQQTDLDIPLDISANELIIGLNEVFKLGINTGDLLHCHLKAENPIALLRGNKLLSEYRLRNGTVINYSRK